MINSLTVKNFQSWSKANLKFDPGVNVIIGPSDSGKTALLRALLWVLTNRPGGDAFRSRWNGQTKVIVRIGQRNQKIVREKDKQRNLYQLNDKEFKAFGQGIPEEILEFHNIKNINIQSQLDGPFLLGDSSGQVARYLNEIVGLDIIHESQKRATRMIRETESGLSNFNERLKELRNDIEKFNNLDDILLECQILQKKENKVNDIWARRGAIDGLIAKINEAEIKFDELTPFISLAPLVDETLSLLEEKDRIKKEIDDLRNIIKQIESTKTDFDQVSSLASLGPGVDELLNLNKKRTGIIERKDSLYWIINSITKTGQELKDIKKSKKKMVGEYNDLAPDICPLCGQEWKK